MNASVLFQLNTPDEMIYEIVKSINQYNTKHFVESQQQSIVTRSYMPQLLIVVLHLGAVK